MVIAILIGLAIIVPTGIWLASASLERSEVKAAVRRCLGQMVITRTYTANSEARVRADIAEAQDVWGVSAGQAARIECGPAG